MSERTPPTTDNEPPTAVGVAAREAAWAEFYNGNIAEDALDRIEAVILAAERASGGRWETFTDGDGEVGVRASGGLDVEALAVALRDHRHGNVPICGAGCAEDIAARLATPQPGEDR